MLVELTTERLQTKVGNKSTIPASATPGTGSLRVSQAEGEGDEASRAGVRFHLASSAATGIAPVQALPTTAAQWLFYMPMSSPVVAFMDVISAWLVSGGPAGAGGTLLVGLVGPAQVPSTIPTSSAAGMVVSNANPASARGSKLVIVSGAALSATPGWAPLAIMNPLGTLLGQTQMEARDIRGKYIVAPGTGLAFAVISPTGTTPLFAPYASWREYATDLE